MILQSQKQIVIFNYDLQKTKCIALPWPFFPFAIIIVKHEGIHFAILQLLLYKKETKALHLKLDIISFHRLKHDEKK
jgi:hypothetical protein